jgi:hypothetical protein
MVTVIARPESRRPKTLSDQCAKEIESRWTGKLASVDVYARSHYCHTALIYARWDD